MQQMMVLCIVQDWVMDGSRMVSISAEMRRDWASSRANIDLLLTH